MDLGRVLNSNGAHDALQIPPGCADLKLIKKQYREMCLRYHPDKHPVVSGGQLADLLECFTIITNSYQSVVASLSPKPPDFTYDDACPPPRPGKLWGFQRGETCRTFRLAVRRARERIVAKNTLARRAALRTKYNALSYKDIRSRVETLAEERAVPRPSLRSKKSVLVEYLVESVVMAAVIRFRG
jgi:hypothetical protein